MAKDMSKGSEAKLIFLFTMPILAGNILQQLYATIDAIVVGQYISSQALASVGTCAPLTILFIALAIGLSTGSSIIISQYFGAKMIDDMRRCISTSLIMLVSFGFILSIVGYFTAEPILKYILAVPGEALDDAVTFFSIYCIGLIFQFSYNIVAAILRAVGDSRATLYFLLISSLLNIALDLFFIVYLGFGIGATAFATVISQAVCAASSFIYLFRKYPVMRFKRSEFIFDIEKGKMALKYGIPTTIQQCVVSVGHIAVQRLVNSFGTDLMEAFTAATRIESYILMPIFSFNAGLAAFTGQNIGAGKVSRVISGYKKTLLMSSVCCIFLIFCAYFGAGLLISMFNLGGLSYEMGVQYLTSVAPFFIIFSVYQMTSSVLQGSGDVVFAMSITLFSLAIRIFASYALAYLTPLAYAAIWWALPIGWVFAIVIAFIRFSQGKWKLKSVVK